MNNSLLEELCLLKQDQINNYFVVVYSPLFTGEYILCQLSVLDKTMINFSVSSYCRAESCSSEFGTIHKIPRNEQVENYKVSKEIVPFQYR